MCAAAGYYAQNFSTSGCTCVFDVSGRLQVLEQAQREQKSSEKAMMRTACLTSSWHVAEATDVKE